MGAPSRKKQQYWRRHVERFRASGVTALEYCRRNKLKPPTLRYWRLHFGEPKGPYNQKRPPAFVSVAIAKATSIPAARHVTRVILPDGTAIETSGDFEAAAQLVRLLRRRPA